MQSLFCGMIYGLQSINWNKGVKTVITLFELEKYLNELLFIDQFRDYAPNGIQVGGKDSIEKIITGVTASAELIQHAINKKADAILVHHGYFWKGEDPRIIGMKHQRLELLLKNNIALLAYHLPLDAHPEFGNNAQLALKLGMDVAGSIDVDPNPNLLWHGRLLEQKTGEELAKHIGSKLNRTPLHIPGPQQQIEKVAWCTGAAQDFITLAHDQKVDAFITGEVSERTFYCAKELGIHFFGAGHHATERYGIQALGGHLAQQFNLEVEYTEIDNPV